MWRLWSNRKDARKMTWIIFTLLFYSRLYCKQLVDIRLI